MVGHAPGVGRPGLGLPAGPALRDLVVVDRGRVHPVQTLSGH